MITLAFKNVWKRKTRSILTILGIIIAIQLYVIMSGIMDEYDQDIQKQVSAMAGRIVVQYKDDGEFRFPNLTTSIPEKETTQIKSLPYIDQSRSSNILFQTIVPPIAPNMPPDVFAVGIEPGKEAAFLRDVDISGRKQLCSDYEAILGDKTAEHYKVQVGDSVTIRDKTFKVIGILPATNRMLDGSFIIPLSTAQDVFVRPGLVSAVILTASPANKAAEIANTITSSHPRIDAATSSDIARSAENLLKEQRKFFTMIDNTSIIIAVLVITLVMVMAINERKKEIGTLKAIGASGSKIISMIMSESLTLSVTGGVLALPISVLTYGLMMDDWVFNFAKWGETVVVAIVIGGLAGLWPAWKAQRVNPLESLRYE